VAAIKAKEALPDGEGAFGEGECEAEWSDCAWDGRSQQRGGSWPCHACGRLKFSSETEAAATAKSVPNRQIARLFDALVKRQTTHS
jgi:hypothetical protein